MRHQINVGSKVNIFYDPMTQTKKEGIAMIEGINQMVIGFGQGSNPKKYVKLTCTVRFEDENSSHHVGQHCIRDIIFDV